MYQVLYVDGSQEHTVLASDLTDAEATTLARREARRRHVGRMFGAGSELDSLESVVVIVGSEARRQGAPRPH